MNIFDISVPIQSTMPSWPKTEKLRLKKSKTIARGDSANDTSIEMGLHTGTHIDAPLHFFPKGLPIDRLLLETFIGPVFVVHLPRVKEITARNLDSAAIPPGVKRILFRTSNSALWRAKTSSFKKNYVGLTVDAAQWLVQRHIILVGVDYLSVAKFDEAIPVHRILLGKKIALLEGVDLHKVPSGMYELICLPINISNVEAAPTRAILLKP